MVWACDRILVATDGSDPSRAAVGWASRLAEDLSAELMAVYGYDVDNETGIPDAEQTAAAQYRLDRWCAEQGALGIDMRRRAYPGDPRSVLRDAIAREQPDLVVVGTRGGGGFPGLVVGSVTEWLTQVATYPLAVVPDTGRDRTGGPILVGVDGSPQSNRALDWAIGLAGRLRRTIEAVYATSGGHDPAVDAVSREIARARAAATALHIRLEWSMRGEHPVTALATRSDDEEPEMIVVGARGFGAFGELTIGRVPRQLLRAAHRPVVIIPG